MYDLLCYVRFCEPKSYLVHRKSYIKMISTLPAYQSCFVERSVFEAFIIILHFENNFVVVCVVLIANRCVVFESQYQSTAGFFLEENMLLSLVRIELVICIQLHLVEVYFSLPAVDDQHEADNGTGGELTILQFQPVAGLKNV